MKTLDPGLYFVKWSNVSTVDGHNLSGSYPFIVLNPDGTFPAGVTLDNAAQTASGQLLPNNIDVALKWIASARARDSLSAPHSSCLWSSVRPRRSSRKTTTTERCAMLASGGS